MLGQAVIYVACVWVGASGAWLVSRVLEHDRQLAQLPVAIDGLRSALATLNARLDVGGR